MNTTHTRRRFLADIGKGALAGAVGPILAAELGLAPRSLAEEAPGKLKFGPLEPLVELMQNSDADALQPLLVAKLRQGVPVDQLIAAGALANARAFGGEDYIGFHTLMALTPALKMAQALPSVEAALPVLKVLYRNTARIRDNGGPEAEVLRIVMNAAPGQPDAAALLEAVKSRDMDQAEGVFAALMRQGEDVAFQALLNAVQEMPEVHRTVLPYRAWDLLDVVGHEHAQTMLRQSLHYCVKAESSRRPEWAEHGKVLARLLDQYDLMTGPRGGKEMPDAALAELADALFKGPPAQAAEAVATALAAGYSPPAVGEALSLASSHIVLRDPGRIPAWEMPGKPVGSVHGDSIGVHASDSANAWRHLASVSKGRNVSACLILGGWQLSRDASVRGDELLKAEPLPLKRHLGEVTAKGREELLGQLQDMIRGNLQSRAAAVASRYGELSHPPEGIFAVLRQFAISEDGSLHAEKYFQTTWDDFHSTRPAFRWRHAAALARVTASEYGRPAAGQQQARELLGLG